MLTLKNLKENCAKTWKITQDYLSIQNTLMVILSSVVLSFAFKASMQFLTYASVFFILNRTLQPVITQEKTNKLAVSLRLLALGMALLPITLSLSSYLNPLLCFVLNAPLAYLYAADIYQMIKVPPKPHSTSAHATTVTRLSQTLLDHTQIFANIVYVLENDALDLLVIAPIFHQAFVGALQLIGITPAAMPHSVYVFTLDLASKLAVGALLHKHQSSFYEFAKNQTIDFWSRIRGGQVNTSSFFSAFSTVSTCPLFSTSLLPKPSVVTDDAPKLHDITSSNYNILNALRSCADTLASALTIR